MIFRLESIAIADRQTLANSSANSDGVGLDATVFHDPPEFADLEALRNKFNELISALRR